MWARVLMNERVTSEERRQSPGEELANAVSAGAGLIAAIAGTPLLFAFGTQRGSDWTVAGAAIFAATTVWLYLASTVYHALPRTRAKRLFRLFDHMGIFLLIAGTYTPFTLGALRGAGGWTLFAAVWSLAILGIGFTVFGGLRFRRLSVCIYLGSRVARVVCRSALLAPRAVIRITVACSGRNRLHRRRCLLPGEASRLQPLHLALVRHRGD